jgi:hypothetical protein
MGMKPRFVIADALVSTSLGEHMILMLSDIGFWSENYEELQQWCQDNGATAAGMTVSIPDEKTLTAFCLKWS